MSGFEYFHAHSEEGAVFNRAMSDGSTALARDIVAACDFSRCVVVGGDFFTDPLPGPVDACVLKHVIHDWDDERASRILGGCRDTLTPDGRVLVIESVFPSAIDTSAACRAATSDVNMLVSTGGWQRTEAEFCVLESAGLELERIVTTASPHASLIEARCRATG